MEFKYNPYAEDFGATAHDLYAHLRHSDPVHQTDFGCYLITRHADVKKLLVDKSTRAINLAESFSLRSGGSGNGEKEFEGLPRSLRNYLLLLNGQGHREARRAMGGLMSPSVLRAATERFNTQVELYDETLSKVSEIDAQADLAVPLAVSFVSGLMGFPQSDQIWVGQVVRSISRAIDIFVPAEEYIEIEANLLDVIDYMEDLIDRKRYEPDDSLLTQVIPLLDKSEERFREVIFHNLILLTIAGASTVNDAIGMFAMGMVREAAQLQSVKLKGGKVECVTEELLRLYSPAEMVSRVAIEPMSLEGGTIEKDTIFCCALASANRDESVFENPDNADFFREKNPHLSFGYGSHTCLGNHAARWELSAFVKMFMNHADQFQLVDEKLCWRRSGVFRGLDQLKLTR
ncbi:MAG: cytochrome P450 [Opitutaceae bacterium]